MIEYLKLENVADERGEEPAKVARTLVRLGYDLYLRFGPSRDSRSGVSFYPEHPTERMEHNIGSGDKQLTKDSQEAVIKRLGRGDTTTEGLTVLDVSPNEVSQKLVLSCDEIVELDPKPEVLKFQIELMEQDDSVCVVVIPDDVAKLPPLPKTIEGASVQRGGASAKNNFQISEKNYHKNKKSNPELHKIFWRAFVHLRDKDEFPVEPQYKQVWETVYDEVETEIQLNEPIPKKRTYDPHEHIFTIDSIDTPYPKLNWLIAGTDGRVSKQGTFSLSSLPSMMTKLKRTPPKI